MRPSLWARVATGTINCPRRLLHALGRGLQAIFAQDGGDRASGDCVIEVQLNLTPPNGWSGNEDQAHWRRLTVIRRDRLGALVHEYQRAA